MQVEQHAPANLRPNQRSEEHTSELQYRCISYAVFCLKKKKASKNVIVSYEYTQNTREQVSVFKRTLDANKNGIRKFHAFQHHTHRMNLDGPNDISIGDD